MSKSSKCFVRGYWTSKNFKTPYISKLLCTWTPGARDWCIFKNFSSLISQQSFTDPPHTPVCIQHHTLLPLECWCRSPLWPAGRPPVLPSTVPLPPNTPAAEQWPSLPPSVAQNWCQTDTQHNQHEWTTRMFDNDPSYLFRVKTTMTYCCPASAN